MMNPSRTSDAVLAMAALGASLPDPGIGGHLSSTRLRNNSGQKMTAFKGRAKRSDRRRKMEKATKKAQRKGR